MFLSAIGGGEGRSAYLGIDKFYARHSTKATN
jgi:hypothetical protein